MSSLPPLAMEMEMPSIVVTDYSDYSGHPPPDPYTLLSPQVPEKAEEKTLTEKLKENLESIGKQRHSYKVPEVRVPVPVPVSVPVKASRQTPAPSKKAQTKKKKEKERNMRMSGVCTGARTMKKMRMGTKRVEARMMKKKKRRRRMSVACMEVRMMNEKSD